MSTVLAIVFYAVLPVLFLLAVILWVIYVHDDFDGHGRAAWRWLTGRRNSDLGMWPGIKKYYDTRLGEHYAVTRDVLSDDFYERVNARRPLIDTLHDSTMMARIDKGEQAEANWLDEWTARNRAMMREQFAAFYHQPEPPDPYLWHDVADLIDRARL